MIRMTRLAQALTFLRLGIIGSGPLNNLALAMQINGSSVEPTSLVSVLQQQALAGIASDGLNLQTNATATATLTAPIGLYLKLTNGGAVVVTVDSAYNIANTIQNPFAGLTFPFWIFSSGAGTVATPTLTDQSVTLVGTTSIAAGLEREYQGVLTQLTTTSGVAMTAGTAFVSLAQQGTTNEYNLVVTGNTTLPVVGQAVLINATGGANPLPAGWYPVVNVTTALGFRIAAPPNNTAWTATGATFPGTAVVPTSAYTPGFPGVFSPLVTISAVRAIAAVV